VVIHRFPFCHGVSFQRTARPATIDLAEELALWAPSDRSGFYTYTRVFNAGFIWDDESHLTQNPCIIGPLGLKEIWTSTRAVYYPLVLTTFWNSATSLSA